MLYLNNTLLTSELIIEAFRQEVLGGAPPASSRAPSPLNKLKDKLKANFFNELTGCDLLLLAEPSQDTDLTALPKKTPLLLKQGDKYFIGRSEGNQWLFTELDAEAIEEALLEFPSVGDTPCQLTYHTKFQRLMNHIQVQESQINMNKKPSDSNVLEVLATDSRFKSEYPCLKYILTRIFSLTDADDKTDAFHQLEDSHLVDWTSPGWSAEYKKLNTQYGYFDGLDEEKTVSLHALFNALASACRTMIVLFEKNNNYKDTLAYEYAYKLMALLLDPDDLKPSEKLFDKISKETYKLLSTLDSKNGKPFHDALLVSLYLPSACDIADRKGWMKLIKQEGIKAFHFLSMAKKIEKKIAELETSLVQEGVPPLRAPKTLTEAQEISKHLLYSRAHENLAFADICYAHHVKEKCVNRCLDYLASGWPKKHEDSIPNVMVLGEDEASGFVWVKLPVNDRRALILGEITMCCQSIGGDSEACVKDAVSRSDNGLYVLLRQRSGRRPAPLIDEQINYANFDIVGQAYAWKSTTGNLCLDSIECLNSVPTPVIKRILTDFSTQVLRDNKDIKRINVGCGGKTPSGLFDESPISEKMKQGTPYYDSATQYCIRRTPHRFNESQMAAVLSLLDGCSVEFKNDILYLGDYITDKDTFVEQLGELHQRNPSFAHEFTHAAMELLLSLNNNPTVEDLQPVDFDALDRLGPEERVAYLAKVSTAGLLWRAIHQPANFARALPYIPPHEFFDVVKAFNNTITSLRDYVTDKDAFVVRLNGLIRQTPALVQEFTPASMELLLSLNQNPTLDDLEPIDFDALDRMNIGQRAAYLASVSTARLLWRTAYNPDNLIRALPYIPKDELFAVVQLMKLYGRDSPMSNWSPTQRNIVYHAVKDRLHELINSAEDFKWMMCILAPEQCAVVCHGIKHRLQDIMTAYDLSQSLAFYAEREKRAAISESLAEQLSYLIHSTYDYHWGTMFLDDSGKEVVYAAIKHQIAAWIKSEVNFDEMLKSFYSDSRKTAFCVDMVDKLPTEIARQRRVFEAMMKYLPEEQRATFCQLHKTTFLNSIQSVKDFTDGMRRFPKEQRASIYEEIEDKLIPMIHSADDFFSARQTLEQVQRTELYEALKDKLPAMLEQKMAQQEFGQDLLYLPHDPKKEVTAPQKLSTIINQLLVTELMELLPAIRTMIGSVFTSFPVCQEVFSSLGIYNLEKRQLIYEVIQDVLIAAITTVDSYNYALNGLSLEQGLSLYESLKGTMPDILPPEAITRIASVDEFTSIVEKFSPKRQVAFYEEWKGRLPGLIQSSYDLSKIRRHLPEEQRIDLYRSIHLPTLITNVEHYSTLIGGASYNFISSTMESQIPSTERAFIYEAMESYLPGFVQSSYAFKCMMQALSLDKKQTEFHDVMKAKLPSLIDSHNDFLNVMEYLTEEQRTEVYEQVKDKLHELIRDCYHFYYATKVLTEAQRTELFLEQRSKWLDKIHTTNDFCQLSDRLPKEYHPSLWEAKCMNNISAHINATVSGIDCKPLARALLTRCEEIKNQLDALFQSINHPRSPSAPGFFENKRSIERLIDALSSLDSLWLDKINTALELKLSAEQLSNFSAVKIALINYSAEVHRPATGDYKY